MLYKNEDLVKHDRNLPGYLQCRGQNETTQEKIFNLGVLDWSRLKNWKSDTKRIMNASQSCNNLALESGSARLSTSINNSIPQQASNGSQIHSSCIDRLPTPRGKAIKAQSSETVPGRMITSLPDYRKRGPRRRSNSSLFSLGDSYESSSHQHWLSESRESCDTVLTEVNERRLSKSFGLEDFQPTTLEILHSCPFPLGTNPDPKCPIEILKGRSLNSNVERITTDKDCMKSDLEKPFVKERHSSLNRRFSFSLEKMAKSFSVKTSSAFPQLSSTYKSLKSKPGSSPDLHDSKSKKGNMRRLLDPLLERKGHQKVQQSNRNPISTIIVSSIHDKQQKSSNVKALLHLRMKNGIPFFKLVEDSSCSILAAAVKKLPSGTDDSSLTYTFYSVHEIKKKNGGWKNQEIGCGFGYNIVGQMKISTSYHAEFSGLERDLIVVRESVLYGPDSAQSDQTTSDCMRTAELATIMVKNTSSEDHGGIGSSKSLVVILPGGIHSGQPSSLINRWRSGGVCDCGGWDIGCELQVLTNHTESIKIPNQSNADRLDLLCQGSHNNKHVFSLASLENGLYSLECNATISLLQAFSICVAVISSQNITHIFQVYHLQDANDFIITSYEKPKNQTTVQAKIPPVFPIERG